VTEELDAGPIIDQDVVHISHKNDVPQLIRKGKDLEKIVLSRAIYRHLERKVLAMAQGCMPAKHIPPNLGTQGLSYLFDGQWEAGISYRYLKSNSFFQGTDELEEIKELEREPRMSGHTFNLFARYSLNQRWSFIMNVPIIYLEESFYHADNIRHYMYPGVQLGDIRISANYWLFKPDTARKGNLAVGLGIKIPTANERVQGHWYTPTGPEPRDLDIAQQPGDGGWGIILESYWIQRLSEHFSLYASGFYLINPRNMNDSPQPMWIEPGSGPASTFASVPDQYNFRLGTTFSISKFAISLGGRIDGMPVNDLIGDSDGFRRPGMVVYVEPALIWSNIMNTINLSMPVALHRNIMVGNYDESIGLETRGGLADYLILVGYTRRF